MPITAKPPPPFIRLSAYVNLINEFEESPPPFPPMARLVTAALIPKTQEYMKGKPRDAQCDAFVEHLIQAFTVMKTKIPKDAAEASRPVLAKVAAKCFKGADDTDRAGEATKETAQSFRKASIMFEILLSGPGADPVLAEDWESKRLYSMKKSASITKALANGQKPEAGNPESDLTPENVERQLREAQEWLANHASAPAEEREEYEKTERFLIKYRQIQAAAPSAPPPAFSAAHAAAPPPYPPPPAVPTSPTHAHSAPAFTYPPPASSAFPSSARTSEDSPLQFARQTVSALQFSDFNEALRNIQGALRMLKGQEPVLQVLQNPVPGKIFDAEDTARHAVSALKFDDIPAAIRCLEDTLKHLTIASH